MQRYAFRRAGGALLACAVLSSGCDGAKNDPALAKTGEAAIPKVPVPPADGPPLGSIANLTPVRERPAKDARQLGYLHAGAKVARADKPYDDEGCEGGWYPIRPRGFVCVGDAATIDMAHPTLAVMSLAPKLGETLPYTYARTKKETPLYERSAQTDDSVREVGKLPVRSALAIVGSWTAKDPKGIEQRLGLTTDGHFVTASDLVAAEPSPFQGVELGEKLPLPVAFVVKRGVRAWDVSKDEADKLDELAYHQLVPLTGRFRSVGPVKYWAVEGGHYVRHRDVTVIRQRNSYPDFVTPEQKWIDVSVITGTLVLYEGKRAVFGTLVSVGRDRLGDPKTTASTAQGDFEIVGKHITALGLDPLLLGDPYQVRDAPWALELSSGQLMLGAYWHDRFGIETGPGAIELSPSDAARVWQWVGLTVPDGWHGVSGAPSADQKVMVRVRK
ncbi:MAG: L,D-transpeptidase [Sorangiineae bacterium]|nr:L,D-transpeptidase [Polyangiaceae bacterium]MEB2322156.1 L,D-transpeptidase [Sorangiineae bacterium]